MTDAKFIAAVLETPLGNRFPFGDRGLNVDDLIKERTKISNRYDKLKYKMEWGLASLTARAEWLEKYLKKNGTPTSD